MPKSQERIAQEREFRKGRIADIAMQLFSRHGFSAVNVERIAQASGYTRVSVYNHFRGKPMIYLYLVRRKMEALCDEIELALGKDLSPTQAFQVFLDAMMAFHERNPSFFELYFLERERVQRDMSPEERAELETAQHRLERLARGVLERGIASGDYRDVDAVTAANLFFASFAGAILLYKTHRFRATLRQFLRAIGHFFLRSLGVEGGPYLLPAGRAVRRKVFSGSGAKAGRSRQTAQARRKSSGKERHPA
jgi:AcrR family transcriptional regulator